MFLTSFVIANWFWSIIDAFDFLLSLGNSMAQLTFALSTLLQYVRVCICVWAVPVILLFHSHCREFNGNSDKGDSNSVWTHSHVFEFASYTVCACVCVCCVVGCRNETRSYNQYVVIYFRCLPSPLPSPAASVCRFNARRAKFARMIRATLRIC